MTLAPMLAGSCRVGTREGKTKVKAQPPGSARNRKEEWRLLSLQELLTSLEQVRDGLAPEGVPGPADREWLRSARRRLSRDPSDAGALRHLESPRFGRICRFLGLSPEEGRRRFQEQARQPASGHPAQPVAVEADACSRV